MKSDRIFGWAEVDFEKMIGKVLSADEFFSERNVFRFLDEKEKRILEEFLKKGRLSSNKVKIVDDRFVRVAIDNRKWYPESFGINAIDMVASVFFDRVWDVAEDYFRVLSEVCEGLFEDWYDGLKKFRKVYDKCESVKEFRIGYLSSHYYTPSSVEARIPSFTEMVRKIEESAFKEIFGENVIERKFRTEKCGVLSVEFRNGQLAIRQGGQNVILTYTIWENCFLDEIEEHIRDYEITIKRILSYLKEHAEKDKNEILKKVEGKKMYEEYVDWYIRRILDD